jgi:phospholipase D1/2
VPDHIFVFNLRSYDRLNATPAIKEQEEKSGVKYQDVQRAQAEEIMSSGIHQTTTGSSSIDDRGDDSNDEAREHAVDTKRQFEAQREAVGLEKEAKHAKGADSIAKDAMKGEPKVSDEPWDGENLETEKDNIVQEELYIHAKVCIIDDKTVICGSSNINDRVSIAYY